MISDSATVLRRSRIKQRLGVLGDPIQELALVGLRDTADPEQGALLRGLYASELDDALFQFARTNRMETIVGHALENALPGAVPEHWAQAHASCDAELQQRFDELDRVAELLAAQDIRLVALKNAGIARGIYPCVGCCPMGDIDVLVDFRRIDDAHRLLVSEGYELASRHPGPAPSFEEAKAEGGLEYRKILDGDAELWFELQWRPVAGRWIRPDQEPDPQELLERSQAIPGTPVRLLAPQDNLLQVALHTAKHSYLRAPGVRLHTDVDRIVRRQDVHWPSFVEQVCTLRTKTAVYFALAMAKALLATPIPEPVLIALRPAGLKTRHVLRRLRRAGLFDPDAKKFTNLQFIMFTASLYDDFGGLWRAVFPDAQWMRQRYEFESTWSLPLQHARRLSDLLLRRSL